MDEVKDNGMVIAKVAEDKTEKFWMDAADRSELNIFNLNKEIEINTKILELAKEKLKQKV